MKKYIYVDRHLKDSNIYIEAVQDIAFGFSISIDCKKKKKEERLFFLFTKIKSAKNKTLECSIFIYISWEILSMSIKIQALIEQ